MRGQTHKKKTRPDAKEAKEKGRFKMKRDQVRWRLKINHLI